VEDSRANVSAQDVIDFIEEQCRVPEGALVGQKVKLLKFQKDFIRAVYDNEVHTHQAILSIGRKNGKTALCAFLMLAHLVGPLAVRNAQLYSAAQSKDQAALLFDLAVKTIRMNEKLNDRVIIRESVKVLVGTESGSKYRALSAEAGTSYGASPVFVLHDELGQVQGERSQLYEALETAQQAHEHPLSIVISTQAPTDSDLLSILIDDALGGHDPSTVVQVHSAEEEEKPFLVRTIKKANPAYGIFQNKDVLKKMADRARRMPSREAAYRNLILNQRVETSNPFVTRSVWQENAGQNEGWGVAYGGLDLSETNDLTALVLVSEANGCMNTECTFWLPGEGLEERSRADRVPYDMWAKQGYLKTTPGRSVEYSYVAKYLVEIFDKKRIRKIAFDRWNMRHLRPWLVEAGMTEAFIDERFVDFGQGYISMSPALRTLETKLLNQNLRHGGHPVLQMCAANAVVKMDEAANRKLDKKKSRGRIDGMVALAMACEVASADGQQNPVYSASGGGRLPVDAFVEDLDASHT
jgi:phage terminase large subunit-like protein